LRKGSFNFFVQVKLDTMMRKYEGISFFSIINLTLNASFTLEKFFSAYLVLIYGEQGRAIQHSKISF